MKATHTDPDLFISELNRDCEANLVERQILRVCLEMESAGAGVVKTISVVAGYVTDGYVVELVRFVGQWWGPESDVSRKMQAAQQDLEQRLEKVAADLDLEIRGGRWTD